MARTSKTSPWRRDFATVPAETRRAGRYALQMLRGQPALLRRLADSDFTAALWALCLPLLDPAVLARLEAEWSARRNIDDDDDDDGDDGLPAFLLSPDRRHLRGPRGRRVRAFLADALARVPEGVYARLARQDGSRPTHPGVALIAECAGLDATETAVLDFIDKRVQMPVFSTLLRETGSNGLRDNLANLAAALDTPATSLKQVFGRAGTLRQLGLIRPPRAREDLEDFCGAEDLLSEILLTAPETRADLLAMIVEPVAPSPWTLADYPHLADAGERLRRTLGRAAGARAAGVNALLYGPPGTGKTEFAQAVASAAGLVAWRVRTGDDEGEGLSRRGRLSAYLLLQRLLRGRDDSLVIFDEVEDAFGGGDNLLLALFGKPSGSPHGDKGWMNRTLEENPLPAIWITNDTRGMDPAFLRRFLLPVAFTTPPRAVRRRMVERHLGDTAVPAALLDELAADEALVPAQFGAARRLLDLQPDHDPADALRGGIAASRRLLTGRGAPRRRQPATEFDIGCLNLAGGIAPARIADALLRTGQGRLCFYGPPGTGKTEFAHILADALGRELVVRTTADLVSKYVGETEQQLAALFDGLDAEHSVLFLDEVDSLLRDRRLARHSWETTQVNELLQQIERFPGIFIAATNLMDGLDPAALRRFDFKLHFRPLTPAQRLRLFAREALGEAAIETIPPRLARTLEGLDGLTPGDFANVVRQRTLLGESLSPEDFLRRLMQECRWKAAGGLHPAAA